MTDVMSADKRSALMSRIKGKNTKPEMLVRRGLWHAGLRFRLHARHLPGRPDLVLPRWHAVVFVHGCFWHQHPGCPLAAVPATRPDFWQSKLAGNRQRDDRAREALVNADWRVAVIWECALRRFPEATVSNLIEWIRGSDQLLDLSGNL
jgi:DNA mismatch endonuclease (patch repair protein)